MAEKRKNICTFAAELKATLCHWHETTMTKKLYVLLLLAYVLPIFNDLAVTGFMIEPGTSDTMRIYVKMEDPE